MKEISLYIHIPFCKMKCWYCDFPSFCGKEPYMMDYVRALSKEIELRTKNYKIKTLFIGGGTPTYLSLEALELLKAAIDKLNKDPNLEFTVECNPGTLNTSNLKLLKDMGVNRLSMGLQAYQNTLLKEIGRIHTVEEFLENYHKARELGFKNINIDLMFGLPNQSLEQWEDTLKNIVKLNPDHLSCYSLILEEETKFYELSKNRKLNLPEEDLERKMNDLIKEILGSNGYEQYEISNYAKPGMECKHNLVYWDLEEYIGCGSSSSSFINNVRYRNIENIEEYIMKIDKELNAFKEVHHNTLEDSLEEFMFMGLRKKKGISISNFYKKFNRDINSVYDAPIKNHISNGLLRKEGDYLFLTEKGVELSNYVMSDFIL